MSASAKEILDKWRNQAPADADINDVMRVVDAFLGPWARPIGKPGSHVVEIHHPVFAKLHLYDGHGRFTIVAHKKKVKKAYIKDIITAIDTIEMMTRVDKEGKAD